MANRITSLFNIQYPVIQAGMIWCSGWELASAVSNAGGLGLIGSGSMYPDVLREQINLLVLMSPCCILILINIFKSLLKKA